MKTEIRVPKMGMDTTEVTVSNWLVKVGDSVEVGSELVELESEKVSFVLEAEVAGEIISIAQPAGSVVPVGDLLGAVETKKD
jgi:pyruvate/2-oxoglutarate dehydrogenase complex dihydrolipoamide acyltransferase (E2) component